MKKLQQLAWLVGVLCLPVGAARAQFLTAGDTFESYSQTTDSGSFTPQAVNASTFGGTTATTIVPGTVGGGVNALEVDGINGGSNIVEGVQWSLATQPTGLNTSTNLSNYTLSFDLEFDTAVTGFEVQIFNNNNSSQGELVEVNTSGMSVGTYSHFSLNLATANSGEPFGKTAALDPSTQSYAIAFDSLLFSGTSIPVSYNLDNVAITDSQPVSAVPEPSTYALLFGGALCLFALRRFRPSAFRS